MTTMSGEAGEAGEGGLRVEHAALDGAAGDLRVTVRRMAARLTQLHQDTAPLRQEWTGGQQEAYRVAKATWDTAMAGMGDLLDRANVTVADANAAYVAADRRGASRFET